MRVRVYLIALMLAGVAGLSASETIATYDFSAGDGFPAEAVEGLEPVAAQWHGIASRHGFDPNTATAFVQTSGLPQPPDEWKTDPEQFLEITLKAKPGYTIDFDALHFRFGGTNRSENPRGVTTEVSTSADDHSSVLDLGAEPKVALPAETADPIMVEFEVPLTDAGFKNQSEVTFRFYPGVSGKGVLIFARYGDIRFIGSATD